MPPAKKVWLHLKSETDYDGFKSIEVYSSKESAVLYSTHYESGRVKELTVWADNRYMHHWGFYESGELEFRSDFKIKPESPNLTIEYKQYFDKKGISIKKEEIHHLSGS
jgi:hypothetical protein